MAKLRGFGGENFLRDVDLRTRELFKPGDFGQRQVGEHAQEPPDIAVLGIAPKLPVVIGRKAVGIEPHGAARGLAHFRARGRGDQRRGQAEQLRVAHAPSQFHALHDVAPLIAAAHLQRAAVAFEQLHEVVTLHDHVIEFQKCERLLTLQAQLHAVHGQHAIDGEVPADIAKKVDVLQIFQPIVVVGHDGARRACREIQKPRKGRAYTGDVGVDLCFGQQLPRFVASRRIAHLGRTAAHQRDGTMACLLQAAQQHDLHQVADVQAVGRGIKADIGRDHTGLSTRVQGRGVRDLVNETTLAQGAQEVGLEWTHCLKNPRRRDQNRHSALDHRKPV